MCSETHLEPEVVFGGGVILRIATGGHHGTLFSSILVLVTRLFIYFFKGHPGCRNVLQVKVFKPRTFTPTRTSSRTLQEKYTFVKSFRN